ncbi:major facilitator superfamily permease [Cupriavidus basilensis OR16]|uniref:Major facilitator superfamily permease n=2 Tax=Cupriavidus basilensis TaxID=68895 RepID=H1S0H5_9BURK|nr:major facilitator superfamily permease [Cupriavidus basilensis OR16]
MQGSITLQRPPGHAPRRPARLAVPAALMPDSASSNLTQPPSPSSATPAAPLSARRVEHAARATMALFFVNGATFATWGVHIPTIKARFGLSDAVLSLAMLAVAAGAIAAMGPVGRWVGRVGSAAACRRSGLVYALATVTILAMPEFALLIPALIAFGMANAAFDVGMNAQAATVEASRARPIMSALHGMFSLGGMTGAAVGGVLLGLGVPPLAHAIGMAALTAAVTAGVAPWLLEDHPVQQPSAHHRAHAVRALWLLGLMAFLGLVGEGAMYDWSSVYMREVAQAPHAWISAGYAAFSGGMACGRFGGDRLRARWSDARLLGGSAWMAFAGILLSLLWPAPAATLAGFTLMGLGTANMVPIFFVAASRLPGVAPAEAISRVARFAYIGLLMGPVMIGGVAHATSLQYGLGVVALTMGWIAVAGARLARPYLSARKA